MQIEQLGTPTEQGDPAAVDARAILDNVDHRDQEERPPVGAASGPFEIGGAAGPRRRRRWRAWGDHATMGML